MNTVAWLVWAACVVFVAALLVVLDVWAATDSVPNNTLSANLRRFLRKHLWVRPVVFVVLLLFLLWLFEHLA
jgi:hypothetical protein